ncbi:archaeal heat shock protein Hsp20 [Candidatus Alkanophaga liquidiphilum]|nr:Small heat shock protein IbpA [Candidatus Alkanophaga liquidiphilum]RLG37668.1 MAG: Hsp20/alpha crystallin family protein [Candidatus Alkanophagales archaeon]
MRRRRPWDIFDELFEDVDRMIERMFRTFRETEPGEFKEPLIYGFSMEIGPDGIPRIQHFGNVRPGKPGLIEEGVREPYTSVMVDEDKNVLRITADMPGIEKDKISVNATEDTVIIRGENSRKYYKECKLDALIDPDSAKATYRNGVLEITFKLKEKRPKGKEIKIE